MALEMYPKTKDAVLVDKWFGVFVEANANAKGAFEKVLLKGKEEGGVIMERHDILNCLNNTRLSNGEFMKREDAEILAGAMESWTPLRQECDGKFLIPRHYSKVSFPKLLSN